MPPARLPFAAHLVRWWVWCYTLGLPAAERRARLDEIESDIWEQCEFARSSHTSIDRASLHIWWRFFLGIPMDVSWRLSRPGAERYLLTVGAQPIGQSCARALGGAFKSRLGMGTLTTCAVFLLAAGTWTAIRDQGLVGDRVDTSLIGIGFSNLDAKLSYPNHHPVELASVVPYMAIKTQMQQGDTVTTLIDGRVLVVGDFSIPGHWNGAQVYDPSKDAWESTAYLADKRRWHTSTLLLDGRVLVAGGREKSGRVLHTAEIFDPADNSWKSTSVMLRARAFHASTLLDDGRVLIIGGRRGDLATLASAEIYDPDTQRWSLAEYMSEPRYSPSMSVLHDGRVLVTGGSDTDASAVSVLKTAEIYDPLSNRWSQAEQFGMNRAGHSATVLKDGRVLVVGGGGLGSNITQAEIYDPAVNTWSAAGTTALARTGHSAAMMSDGRVIVAGGWSGGSSAAHLVEIYDPRVGTWLTMAVTY